MRGRLTSVIIPVAELPRLCVLDGVAVDRWLSDWLPGEQRVASALLGAWHQIVGRAPRGFVAVPSPGQSMGQSMGQDEADEEPAPQEDGATQALVRIDGVALLLSSHPVVVRRLPEGPIFEGDEGDEDDDEEGDDGDHDLEWRGDPSDDGDDGDDDDDLDCDLDPDDVEGQILADASFPAMEPIVVSLVVRPARLGREDEDSFRSGKARAPIDRMDETSDRLCLIDERTGLLVLEVGARWRKASTRSGLTLPMSSGINVPRDQTTVIRSRPQAASFRPRRLIIGHTPRDWIVNDVRIGRRSQFSQAGAIPGEVFSAAAIDSFVSLEVVGPGVDLEIEVTYVGDAPGGAPFVCVVVGDVAGATWARQLRVRWTPEGRTQGWMLGLTGEDESRDLATSGSPQVAAPGQEPAVEPDPVISSDP